MPAGGVVRTPPTGPEFSGGTGTAISTHPKVGIALTTANGPVAVAPAGLDVGAPDGAVVGDSVMYPRTGPETDTIVRANGSGFETFTVVKSSAVPAVSQWSVGLPPGYHLAIEETGTVVVVGADHMVIAEADPPSARDASGRPVPVTYAVNGDRLSVFAHPAVDTQFPIVIDPSWHSIWRTVKNTAVGAAQGLVSGAVTGGALGGGGGCLVGIFATGGVGCGPGAAAGGGAGAALGGGIGLVVGGVQGAQK